MLFFSRQKRARLRGLAQPPAHEHLGEGATQCQLAPQPLDILAWALGDLKAAGMHAATLGPR